MKTDIAIVGAGPAGLVCAREAARQGVRVDVFERKTATDLRSCCGGLISRQTLSILGVSDGSVLQTIRAARVHLPDGRQISLRSSLEKAVVVDRPVMEQELRESAEVAGATLHFGSEAIRASRDELVIRCGDQEQSWQTSLIIGADGPRSRIADWFHLEHPADIVSAAQATVRAPVEETDTVGIFVGESIAPGFFFGWSIPVGESTLRVGLAVAAPQSPTEYLGRLLDKHFAGAEIASRSAGLIPLSLAPETAVPGALLVGDAAGHLKPLSGGGLCLGGRCARLAGVIAVKLSQQPEDTARLLESYRNQCRQTIGKEQSFGRRVRHHVQRFGDAELCQAAGALDDPQLLQFIADRTMIDELHQLPGLLASEPRLWSSMLRMIPLMRSFAE